MEGTYSICCGAQKVGTAVVSAEGLYYSFRCRCQLDKKAICKLCVSCGDERILLGTPIPEGQYFVLRTRIPKKRFGAGEIAVCVAFEGDSNEIFVPVRETELFPYLKEIKNAYAQVRGGEPGIVFSVKNNEITNKSQETVENQCK